MDDIRGALFGVTTVCIIAAIITAIPWAFGHDRMGVIAAVALTLGIIAGAIAVLKK